MLCLCFGDNYLPWIILRNQVCQRFDFPLVRAVLGAVFCASFDRSAAWAYPQSLPVAFAYACLHNAARKVHCSVLIPRARKGSDLRLVQSLSKIFVTADRKKVDWDQPRLLVASKSTLIAHASLLRSSSSAARLCFFRALSLRAVLRSVD